jgi:hypothetical protein
LPKLFLGVLAVAWIVVLVPPIVRARNDSRSRGDSVGDFQNRLGVLGRTHSRRAARAARLAGGGTPGRAARGPRTNLAPMSGGAMSGGPMSGGPMSGGIARGARPANRRLRSAAPRPLTGPIEPVRTRSAEQSARRRREVVTILFTSAMLSAAVASALGGGLFWGLQILCDLLLLTYCLGLVMLRSNGNDRMQPVAYLPQVRPRPVPAYALRRTASS